MSCCWSFAKLCIIKFNQMRALSDAAEIMLKSNGSLHIGQNNPVTCYKHLQNTQGHTVSTRAKSYREAPCFQFTAAEHQGYIVLRKVSDYVCHPNVHMTPGEWFILSKTHCVAHFGSQLREQAGSATGHNGAPFAKYLAITDSGVARAFVFSLQQTAMTTSTDITKA